MSKKKDKLYVLKRRQSFYRCKRVWGSDIRLAKKFKTVEEAHEVAKSEFVEGEPVIHLYQSTEPRFEKMPDEELVSHFGNKSVFHEVKAQHFKECIVCGKKFDRLESDDSIRRWNKCSEKCVAEDLKRGTSIHDPDAYHLPTALDKR